MTRITEEQRRQAHEWFIGVAAAHKRGWQARLAKCLDTRPATVSDWFRDVVPIPAHDLPGIADFFGVSVPFHLTPWREKLTLYPFKGTVMGGQLIPKELPDPVPAHPGLYGNIPNKYVIRINDRSMNELYPPGSDLMCADIADLAGEQVPTAEKKYLVKRTKAADGKNEIAVRQARRDESGAWWLWPRSSDPEYQIPWPYPGRDGDRVVIEARILRAMIDQ